MADQNPTGGGCAVALTIPAGNLPFLRRILTAARDGAREDLDRFGENLAQPARRLRDEAISAQLLDAIEGAPLHRDEELVEFVLRLAAGIDRDNDYARIAAEHDALYALLAQLEGRVS